MSDWLHNLSLGGMALIVFGVTYLVAAVIYVAVMARGGRASALFEIMIRHGDLPTLHEVADLLDQERERRQMMH